VFEAYIVNLPAGDHFKPDYVAINPKSTIPTLVRRDGTSLTEIQAIAYWLARSHPRAKLWPDGAESESRLIEAMAYIVGTIHGQASPDLRHQHLYQKCNRPRPVRELGRDIVTKGFAILNDAIGSQNYLAGDYSVADAILFYVEFWADKTSIALPENLVAHYTRMLTRPAVQRVLREEGYNTASLGRFSSR
jgi:glutathione S-transferase